MNGRKNILITLGLLISASLIASAVSAILVSCHYNRLQFDLLSAICNEVVEQAPQAREIISAVLKEYTAGNVKDVMEDTILSTLGYQVSDFSDSSCSLIILSVIIGFTAGISLFILTFLHRNKTEARRIQALADYLEQVNTGKAIILSTSGEDDFSKLEDEIYKTVSSLYHAKDAAIKAKDDFAENLANIAHQIKTPITALSLSAQMMRQSFANIPSFCSDRQAADPAAFYTAIIEGFYTHLERMEKQVLRLTHLEEALLVLSRIDAGTLLLQKNETDVYTMLVLAADNLQELLAGSQTSIDIPETGELMIVADLDWTMEAVMNLMKNCIEHNDKGTIHCSYAQNSLYTEIQIWDEGKGFAKADIPHLFERFYRGQNAGEGGVGIGLALAKEIIERQNGTIQALNRPGSGALFEIRFYCH